MLAFVSFFYFREKYLTFQMNPINLFSLQFFQLVFHTIQIYTFNYKYVYDTYHLALLFVST